MSTGLSGIINTLESLAEYNGPWRVMVSETDLLKTRLTELRERERRLDDVLLVALVGGSGVGKSTLLNALAGDQIAETSEMRPCTSTPTVYHPPGMQSGLSNLSGVRHIARSALEHIALIDTPDSDTIVKEHRHIVEQVLQECDLILLCADGEKYLDEATWSLLEPMRGLRALVCVETKVLREDTAIREHWLKNLEDKGFNVEHYFRVNALHALDRKLMLSSAGGNEYDFCALEGFLRHELDKERVSRIKSSNAAGLLGKTINRLHERVKKEEVRLSELKSALEKGDEMLVIATLRHFTAGGVAEPHLWTHALGHEVSLRTRGMIGSLYKLVELIRSLPYRAPNWLRLQGRQQHADVAATMLFSGTGTTLEKHGLPELLVSQYTSLHSEIRLKFIRAGFEMPDTTNLEVFRAELEKRLCSVLDGSIQKGLVMRARGLCAWPVTVIMDFLPVALLVYTAYLVMHAYWTGNILPASSFLHTGVVLLLLIFAEISFLSLLIHFLAWTARIKGIKTLKNALAQPDLAFNAEKELLKCITELIQTIEKLHCLVIPK